MDGPPPARGPTVERRIDSDEAPVQRAAESKACRRCRYRRVAGTATQRAAWPGRDSDADAGCQGAARLPVMAESNRNNVKDNYSRSNNPVKN
jgi:hypothetical protein